MALNSRKVAMVGCGFVGSASAFALMQSKLFSEMVLIDADQNRAEGEALDISHGMAFASPMKIYAGTYDDVSDAAIIVITAGANQKPEETRLDLIQKNAKIMRSIIGEIKKRDFEGILLIVSNPVDILTYVFSKISGLPEHQIMGSGTILDTSRLQSTLAKRFHISPKNVHAHVYGEHGDSSFVPWSLVHIANNHIDSYKACAPDGDSIKWDQDYAEVEEFVSTSGAQVIKAKGATFYAVAISVCHICKCIFNGAGTALTVSTMMHGEYGVEDVALSTLTIVDRTGVRGKIMNHLTDGEVDKLRASAAKLKDTISKLSI